MVVILCVVLGISLTVNVVLLGTRYRVRASLERRDYTGGYTETVKRTVEPPASRRARIVLPEDT